MIRRLTFWLAAIWAAAAVCGCASSAPPQEFVGRYSSTENPWYLNLDREGNMEFSFSDNPDIIGRRMVVRGYCDFDVEDPHAPNVYPQLDAMRGKFKLEWSKTGDRLVVRLMLPDNNEMVIRHGRQVTLYKENPTPAD